MMYAPVRRAHRLAAVAAAVVLAGAMITPALAAHDDHHDRGPARHYHHGPPAPAYGYGAQTYVATPPPLVYGPPVYASPFNLGLSFNIR
jgi:hypothetical protein